MIQLFKSKTQNKQLLCNYGVFIINGMLALSIGSLLPYIRDSRGLEYTFCGMILSLHSVGNLISGFISGALPAVLGRKKSILLFNAFFALSYLVIIFSDKIICWLWHSFLPVWRGELPAIFVTSPSMSLPLEKRRF